MHKERENKTTYFLNVFSPKSKRNIADSVLRDAFFLTCEIQSLDSVSDSKKGILKSRDKIRERKWQYMNQRMNNQIIIRENVLHC